MTYLPNQPFMLNDFTAQTVLNWVLPAVGSVIAIALIIYLWRYLRKSNEVGRISEFDEKTFKKLIVDKEESEQLPVCNECKMPMRVEIRYKDFMKDQGDFLIDRKTAKNSLQSLVDTERISQEDMDSILEFFDENPEINQQLFKRYKCPSCKKVEVLPYRQQTKKDQRSKTN